VVQRRAAENRGALGNYSPRAATGKHRRVSDLAIFSEPGLVARKNQIDCNEGGWLADRMEDKRFAAGIQVQPLACFKKRQFSTRLAGAFPEATGPSLGAVLVAIPNWASVAFMQANDKASHRRSQSAQQVKPGARRRAAEEARKKPKHWERNTVRTSGACATRHAGRGGGIPARIHETGPSGGEGRFRGHERGAAGGPAGLSSHRGRFPSGAMDHSGLRGKA